MTNVDACSNLGDGFVTPVTHKSKQQQPGTPITEYNDTSERTPTNACCSLILVFPSRFLVTMVRLSLAKVFPSPLCRRVLSKMVMGAFVLRLEP